MTWSALFEVTEVAGQKVVAKAATLPVYLPGTANSVEVGTLTQNTEHVVRMELHVEVEEGHQPTLQVGDKFNAYGHFSA
jgi:hypothetical protein